MADTSAGREARLLAIAELTLAATAFGEAALAADWTEARFQATRINMADPWNGFGLNELLGDLHSLVRKHPLELVVLGFQIPQAVDVRRFHAAVLGLPGVIRRFRDAQLAAHVFDLPTALDLLQRRDDLALGEFAVAHRSLLGG